MSGGAPQFMLATGGNDNLVKLWDIFTASGTSASIAMQFFVYFFPLIIRLNLALTC